MKAGPPRPRPADPTTAGQAEYYEVLPGQWAVVVFGLIPKNGFEHLNFPHFWGAPGESPRWRVARHGELPGDTFLFESKEHATTIVTMAFDDPAKIRMCWVTVPSDDRRRR